MTDKEENKQAENFEEPSFPYVLFEVETRVGRAQTKKTTLFTLPVDGCHGTPSAVQNYINKGHKIVKFNVPETAQTTELVKYLEAVESGNAGKAESENANLRKRLAEMEQELAKKQGGSKPEKLDDKTVEELQGIAKENDVVYSGLVKADLIQALREAGVNG